MTYKICSLCIMDSSDSELKLNGSNICAYCEQLDLFYKKNFARTQDQIDNELKSSAMLIKQRSGRNKYDCVLGLSGGVDSTYVADLLVDRMKLNPLIIHFDNGWNSSIAVENIKKLVTKLNLDMITYVIDWAEFKDLQKAFIRASVIDIEMLTDNAIYGALIKIAKRKKIKCIVSGENLATESGLPNTWRWEKLDSKNIKSIHRKFGERKIKNFPIYGPGKLILDRLFSGIYYFYPLNIIQYNKNQAMKLISDKYQWNYYGGKHYESVFTKFYQAYILPTKFGIDKRRAHLSSLIRNREINRDEALAMMLNPLYEPNELQEELDYILKKLSFTEDEFQYLMSSEPKKHIDYASHVKTLLLIKKIAKKLRVQKDAFI